MKTKTTSFLDIQNGKSTKSPFQKPFLNKELVGELIELDKIVGGAMASLTCNPTQYNCDLQTKMSLCFQCK